MADITVTLPDALLSEIITSLEGEFTRDPGESDPDFVRRYMRDQVKKCVHRARIRNAIVLAELGVEVPQI